ncbi:amino acid permease [Candidatus Aerophobetes bacterium]|uniref:Amino acid permease n=1 Tax=Aerophobetes bacterium TaxID=2030807 RepID=A0A523WAC7_UNCAE|nr:MAG: amino acid permease [Candidatus Aerophobetes bacterium]
MRIRHEKLIRQLGGIDVFSIAAGAMISSGLFVLPGLVYAKVGPAVILAYILAGVLILPALFAKTELATAMPRAGGSYFFIERSMGSAAGTIGGFASWLSLSLKSAFALVGIGVFATLINPSITEWEIKLIAIAFCVFFIILNLTSVKLTGKVQVFLVMLLIALLCVYIFRGAMSLNVQRYAPFMPLDRRVLLAAVGMVFISFGGLTKVTSIGEEIKDPARNIPYGMILAFCVVLLLYALTLFVTTGLLEGDEFAHSLTPISTGAHKIFGTIGGVIMGFAAIIAFVSTANAGILSASRFPMAMSRDQLLPESFAKVNKRFNTPHFSIIFTGIFMIVVILFLNLENLIKVASTMKIILFILVILACIIMRESKILNYKPAFASPLYPWLPIVGLIAYGFLLYGMGSAALLTTGGFILASILWHKIYVREKAMRKAALIHIVERITAKEIAGDSLGAELRKMLRERDEIVEDRFDRLVKECEIIDIGKQTTLIDFFTIAAEKLAKRLNTDARQLVDSLIVREKDTTTVIRPGLAIPHITVDGEHKFELVVARCEAGINFTETLPPVYAVFILVGSLDERNFHLRALSAIAQITQDVDFDKNWLRAKNIEELRDIVLLAKRHRERA